MSFVYKRLASVNGPFPLDLAPFVCFANGKQQANASTAILLRTELSDMVQNVRRHKSGRMITVELRCESGNILLSSCYMPSGLERRPDTSLPYRTALSVAEWACTKRSVTLRHFIGGDFNETRRRSERVQFRPGEKTFSGCDKPRILPVFFRAGFVDGFDIFERNNIFTCSVNKSFGVVQSVLD